MKYNKNDIKDFIPHREPFLFLDSIDDVLLEEHLVGKQWGEFGLKDLEGVQVHASYKVASEHVILDGHFPGNPILPGVVQIEIMAQASCFVLVPVFRDYKKINLKISLVTVDKVKLRKPLLPNDQLSIITKCKKVRGNMLSFDAKIFQQEKICSEASFMANVDWEEKE